MVHPLASLVILLVALTSAPPLLAGERIPTEAAPPLPDSSDTGGPCTPAWLLTPAGRAALEPFPPGRSTRSHSALPPALSPELLALAARSLGEPARDPVTRTTPVLVVLVDYPTVSFSDNGIVETATHDFWRRSLLGLVSDSTGQLRFDSSQESLRDFWSEASFGRVNVYPVEESFDAAAADRDALVAPDAARNDGIVQVRLGLPPYTLGYYWPLQLPTEYKYMKAVLHAADRYVDFAALDRDGDRIVDRSELALFFIFANPDDIYKGDWIWPHRFALPPHSLELDGVFVGGGDPSIHPEVQGGSYIAVDQYRPTRTLRHEFGHDLGLPDLYNVSVTGDRHNDGIGTWGVMASSDAMPEAWSRFQLGWIREDDGSLVRVQGRGEWELHLPAISSATLQPGLVYQLENPQRPSREYFLFEHRRRTGKYEQTLPGEGVLITHAFDSRLLYRISATNLGMGEQVMGLQIVEADGLWNLMDPDDDNKGDEGDPFQPGQLFSDETEPPATWYGEAPSGITLEIQDGPDAAGEMRALLRVSRPEVERFGSARTGRRRGEAQRGPSRK